jgi:hypothetical protein
MKEVRVKGRTKRGDDEKGESSCTLAPHRPKLLRPHFSLWSPRLCFDQERMFRKYDRDRSGSVSYEEFKLIWLKVTTRAL